LLTHAACSGTRRFKAISIPPRYSRRKKHYSHASIACWPMQVQRQVTSSTSDTASGRKPIPTPSRVWLITSMSEPAMPDTLIRPEELHDGMTAQAVRAFHDIQDRICAAFEALDPGYTFERNDWQREPEHRLKGGGRMRVMRGKVFEKVGVNF